MSRIGIIGAGPSGLSLSLFLNAPSLVLEQGDRPGGHAASYEREGFTFDYGPHIMFSKDKEILQFMVDSLGDNVARCRRNNKISFKGKLSKYPFENDLKSLPLEDCYACVRDYFINPYKEKYPKPANMREWLLHVFGMGICERYLFPYNEKVWNLPVEKLAMLWADRIPNPDPADLLKSALGYETEGYLHQLYYHYPKRGGYQALSDAWAAATRVEYRSPVTAIERLGSGKGFAIESKAGRMEFDSLVSTLPIHLLPSIYRGEIPSKVRQAIDRLIVNPMYVVSLGVKGADPDQFTAIYFPEKEFLVNRVSYPCTFSELNGPSGHHSIQAEITCTADSDTWKMSDQAIADHVLEGLLERKLVPSRESVLFVDVRRMERSYVVYDIDYQSNVEIVRSWFDELGLHLLGRFSAFEYVNVDMAVERALQLASRLNASSGGPQLSKPELLARALERTRAQ